MLSKVLKINEHVEILEEFHKCSKINHSLGEIEMLALLYEFLAETRLTVYRRLDMKSNTKTTAKRARVGPRTYMHMTMEILFWKRISSSSELRSSIFF